jgi:hypothetical protein
VIGCACRVYGIYDILRNYGRQDIGEDDVEGDPDKTRKRVCKIN